MVELPTQSTDFPVALWDRLTGRVILFFQQQKSRQLTWCTYISDQIARVHTGEMPPFTTTPCQKSRASILAVLLKMEWSIKCCNSGCLFVSVMDVAASCWCSISTGSDLFPPICCLIRSMIDFPSLSLLALTNGFSPYQPSTSRLEFTHSNYMTVLF